MNWKERVKRKVQEKKLRLSLLITMVLLSSFGSAHAALNNSSNLYELYKLIDDFVEIVDPLVSLVLKLVVLIFIFVVIGFMKGLFGSILKNMKV